MKFTAQEVLQYVQEDEVKFIRLAFCDIFGHQRNLAIMPGELERAFTQGIAIDASAIAGLGGEVRSDVFLHPDPTTLVGLPWRPETGKVVRMFCDISYPDGTPLETDSRHILLEAVAAAEAAGVTFSFGPEMEFYLFTLDDEGEPTANPYDKAGYMAVAPEDKGENIRREICLTLEKMGIIPESSHHEEGPGQNEIDFRYSDAMSAADNTLTFRNVVKTIAWQCGLSANFSPKPLADKPGNGMHINISVNDAALLDAVIAGIMNRIAEITLFLNTTEASYQRLGSEKAPGYISWSTQNRSQLIRIPATTADNPRAELRSADPLCNPYIAFALLIYAGLEGVEGHMSLPEPADVNLFTAPPEVLAKYEALPASLAEAAARAKESAFVQAHLPQSVIDRYCH